MTTAPKTPSWLKDPITNNGEGFSIPSPNSSISKSPYQALHPLTFDFSEQPRRIYLKDGRYGSECSIELTRVEESWIRALMMRVALAFSKDGHDFPIKVPSYTTKSGRSYLNLKVGRVNVNGENVQTFEDLKVKLFKGHVDNGQVAYYKALTSLTLGSSFWVKFDTALEGPQINLSLYVNKITTE